MNYSKRLKISLLLTLVISIMLFSFVPSIGVHPYVLRKESKEVVLMNIVEPLQNVRDIQNIPLQTLPKKIVETEDASKASDPLFISSFDDTSINYSEDNTIYTIYETPPVLINTISVEYPLIATKLGLEGKVFLKIIVEKDGKVSSVEVLKSDNQIFDDYAVRAGRAMIFTPAMTRDMPIRCVVTIPIVFRLKG